MFQIDITLVLYETILNRRCRILRSEEEAEATTVRKLFFNHHLLI